MRENIHISNKETGIISGILLVFACGLLILADRVHGFADWYSTHIYPLWVKLTGRMMGIFPFSVSEVLLYLLLALFCLLVVKMVVGGVQKKVTGEKIRRSFFQLLLLASVLFFLYVVNCGINYNRKSFAESSGMETMDYSAGDLEKVCEWLTEEVNQRSQETERDTDGCMSLAAVNGGSAGTQRQAAASMQKLGKEYTQLAGYYPRPKGLVVPWILSVQNLTGVYSPFTVEANYNSAVVDYYIPFTACHELSHLRGFMQEEEANFIAFLACTGSDNIEFQYSGYLMGWTYCMNVLYRADYEAWEVLRAELSSEVEADLQANSEFWAKYDGAVAEVSNKVNDTYLKANGQADGVKSYNRMVDLIVAYYGEKKNR